MRLNVAVPKYRHLDERELKLSCADRHKADGSCSRVALALEVRGVQSLRILGGRASGVSKDASAPTAFLAVATAKERAILYFMKRPLFGGCRPFDANPGGAAHGWVVDLYDRQHVRMEW